MISRQATKKLLLPQLVGHNSRGGGGATASAAQRGMLSTSTIKTRRGRILVAAAAESPSIIPPSVAATTTTLTNRMASLMVPQRQQQRASFFSTAAAAAVASPAEVDIVEDDDNDLPLNDEASSSEGADAPTKQTKAKTAKKKPRRRRVSTIPDKDPIVVTPRAAERIRELLSGENAEGALGIRLGVRRRGCNGLSYTLNYAFEKPPKDIEMTIVTPPDSDHHELGSSSSDNDSSDDNNNSIIKVYIDPMALFTVVGTTMDYEETELTSEFTFNNPNSKGECGCGESFTV